MIGSLVVMFAIVTNESRCYMDWRNIDVYYGVALVYSISSAGTNLIYTWKRVEWDRTTLKLFFHRK